jgi:hypothetical protein
MADEQTEAAVAKGAAFVVDNWDALGIEEHAGVLHMPASIQRRNKKGGLDSIPVMLRNVTNAHKFSARTQARSYAVDALHFDLDRDAHLVEQLENYAILAYAIRDPKTYDQHAPNVEALLKLYDTQSLLVLWGIYNTWIEMLDPRYGKMDGDQLWQVILRIAQEKSVAPLVAMPGFEQFTCMVLMAEQALLSPKRPSWLRSSETSTAVS